MSPPHDLTLDVDLVSVILEFQGHYRDAKEKSMCQRMVEALIPEEQEIAARTSYTYWMIATTDGDCTASDATRKHMAMKEARRHLVGEGKNNYENAMKSLRETCKFRKDRKIDLLRLCFANNAAARACNQEDKELLSRWETLLDEEIEHQTTWVGGHDRDHRAILHRSSRSTTQLDEEAFNLLALYMAERAYACSEIYSKGREEKILLVLDYSNYQSDMVPPKAISLESIKMLQRIYPERAKKIFVLDPPLWLQIAYLLISPFLVKETRDKICVVAGKSQRVKKIGAFVDVEQATPVMLDNGKLRADVDVQQLLRRVPFHMQYDSHTPRIRVEHLCSDTVPEVSN
jgi:hypothetical protein